MKRRSIGFIGGGRITKIMLHGFMNKNIDVESITVSDINSDVLVALKAAFPLIEVTENAVEAARNDLLFIALHPPAIVETLTTIKAQISDNALIVSLAPKITLAKLALTTGNKNIARMIPNASSWINKGYNPVCFSKDFPEKDDVLELLRTLGHTFETEEQKLESYAIISAMLPTYFWFQFQELEKIGLHTGLEMRESREALRETLLAATQLFYSPDLTHEEVIDLIPVKPIAEHEQAIIDCFSSKLLPLFEKIKPEAVPT